MEGLKATHTHTRARHSVQNTYMITRISMNVYMTHLLLLLGRAALLLLLVLVVVGLGLLLGLL